MLSFTGNNVLAFFLIEFGCTFNRQVVRLGGTGSEHDFTRVSADQISNLVTGNIDSLFGLPAKAVRT